MVGGWVRRQLAVAVLALPLLAAAPADTQQHFATPEDAVTALVAAVHGDDPGQLTALFGPDGVAVISTGDPVENQNNRDRFVAAYDTKHSIDTSGETATLSIGTDDWPFPIPLKHTPEGWFFDVAAGEQEILDRRIGANELYAEQVVLAYVDAQNEYAQTLHDGNRLHVYAQHLLSSPGKQDGLYWPTASGETPSPLGPLIAEARASGYHPGEGAAQAPYHGYLYKILTGQGPHAPGGAYGYVVNGQMLGGFGLVAWPARWGNSGVMTFIVNQDGEIYAKDLGPGTAGIAAAMTRFDPDRSWQKVGAPAPIVGEAESGG
jgi:hypothetical protein